MQTTRKEVRGKLAASLRKSAETLTRQIEAKRNPAISMQNLTARRARLATGMSADADYMERLMQTLNGMATDLDNNQLPPVLRGVTTKSMVESLMLNSYRRPGLHMSTVRDVLKVSRYMKEARKERASIVRLRNAHRTEVDYFLDLKTIRPIDNMLTLIKAVEGKPGVYLNGTLSELNNHKRLMQAGITSAEKWQEAHEAIVAYTNGPSPERIKEKKLKELEYGLIGCDIPGFFPTPKGLAEQLVLIAAIKQGMTVLEPSAGKGDIAEIIIEAYPGVDLKAIEINYTLVAILEAKGFKVTPGDFLQDTGFYDRIIMNPPFENGQDIDHVRWAYSRLKPGGKVVSIMCAGPFFRNDKKSADFRSWLHNRKGKSLVLNTGSFQGAESFRQTGVNARIIILEKKKGGSN